jgi:bifunctional non-homologous end joining protein LigD
VIDAQSGTTKIELVRYYALVAPLMMEHLKAGRSRWCARPTASSGQLFFQKHLDRYKMAGVKPLDPAIFPGHPPMLEIASPRACCRRRR